MVIAVSSNVSDVISNAACSDEDEGIVRKVKRNILSSPTETSGDELSNNTARNDNVIKKAFIITLKDVSRYTNEYR